MTASPADSAILRDLMGDPATAAFFADSAELHALLLVEGTLARVQGELGVIPADAAAFIDRASREVQIDPSELAASAAVNGVPVPGLLAALRKAAGAPDMMRWLHWGATSQDIMDTALALRLARMLDLWETRLAALISALGGLAGDHADLPMAARTYGQAATPSSFGAMVAGWGRPFFRHRERMVAVRAEVLKVSLSGAAGTLSAMGPEGPRVRAALAAALGLADSCTDWHAERDGIIALGGWMANLCASLGKMGEDLILLAASGLSEVRIDGSGGSSTMPQKQNPVGPSLLVALARHVAGLSATLTGAGLHRQARDGAAWFTEWLVLPQMCIATGRALALAGDLTGRIVPDRAAMARVLDADAGTIHAEALTFALSARLPRPEAETAVKRLCTEALSSGTDLRMLAARDWPGLEVAMGLGQAPAEALAFAQAARDQ